jgi:endonuclease/exonuclease/phosphatase family metal-dependent hydrolase
MQVFDGFLESLTTAHEVQSTLSKLHFIENVACDHILVSPDIQVKDFRVLDPLASDHQALILEFEL